MAIILKTDRPALRLEGEGLAAQTVWADTNAALRNVVAAARSVGRVEIEGGVFPWAGTAFVVAPRLALTAAFVGKAITDSTAIWLNFADGRADELPRRIRVNAVERVHPYWRFSFLCLDSDAPVAPLAISAENGDDLQDREIAVIGYSSFDQRNEKEVQNAIFGNFFDLKRVSPGRIMGFEDGSASAPRSLIHDASTLGGSGGAPVIDVASGQVLGIHYSGIYLQKNTAIFASDARGDPQWERLWAGGPGAAAMPPPGGKPAADPREIFDYTELKAIKAWLGQARINDESSLRTLFLGLSPEFMGQVPAAELIIDRIELALDYLNDRRKVWGGRAPLYYVLTNARERRQFEPDAQTQMDVWIAKVGT